VDTTPKARPRRVVVASVLISLAILTAFASLADLLAHVIPALQNGSVPDDPYPRRYVLHPWPAALHIVPGLIYIFGSLLQLSARFRRKHLALHRRLGRVVLICGLLAATFAVIFGLKHPFSGISEASAAVVFGCWFFACLVLAFAAVRRRDIAQHRRWMIRAFAVGIGIGTVRLWVGILAGVVGISTGVTPTGPEASTYGIAFWLGFGLHVAIGEWWLRPRPAVRAAT
jgi:uncharacterized membrane protein